MKAGADLVITITRVNLLFTRRVYKNPDRHTDLRPIADVKVQCKTHGRLIKFQIQCSNIPPRALSTKGEPLGECLTMDARKAMFV